MKLNILYEGSPSRLSRRDILRKAAIWGGAAAAGAGLASTVGPEVAKHLQDTEEPTRKVSEPPKIPKTEPEDSNLDLQPAISAPQEPVEPHQFNYADFRDRLEVNEGNTRHAHRVGDTNEIDIGMGHVMFHPHHTNPTANSRRVFRQLFGNSVDFDAVLRGQQDLSERQLELLNNYEIDRHLLRARRRFPYFDNYPQEAQFAILDAIYRGDMGPRTASLINQGRFEDAAEEYLNHRGYRTATSRGLSGIRRRMEANRDGLLTLVNR